MNEQGVKTYFTIYNIIYYILGIIEVILGFRFIFRLLGANPNNAFVSFLYNISSFLLQPFKGIFSEIQGPGLETGSVFEPQTLVAMLVYTAAAYLLIGLINILFAPKNIPE